MTTLAGPAEDPERMDERQRKLKELVGEALERPAQEREGFVRTRAGDDAALAAEALELLSVEGSRQGFLAGATSPAMNQPPRPVEGPLEGPGSIIGPYKLLEQIGEGGFGVVYMAEQLAPVRRRVALKIIKPGMDTRQVIARFEQERQALAIMEHPSIAKVFDAGATESGRPYFVMELVRGEKITKFCDGRRMSVEDRLALFRVVCEAVQHAHQKGIVHRDLKPANILAAELDGRPQVKVIDFGIAKSIDTQLIERTLFTEFQLFVGTPEYMSPEQAGGAIDIDTRSDIYALGVLLFELLTGSTPLDGPTLRRHAYEELRRLIREGDTPKPSTRLASLAASRPAVAAARSIEPAQLAELLRGDLDWVVMRALEKDRSRRYAAVSDLAADLLRFTSNQPVSARPPSRLYYASRFVRRHKVAVFAGSCVFAAVLLGGIAAAVGFVNASKARDDTEWALTRESAQRLAAERSERSRAAVEEFFLGDVFGRADPDANRGRAETVREALDRAAVKAAKITDPAVKAAVLHQIGRMYIAVQRDDAARKHLDEAVRMREAAAGAAPQGSPDAAEARTLLADSLLELARAKQEASDSGMGIDEARRAESIRRELFGSEDLRTVEALLRLGIGLHADGQFDEAERAVRSCLATIEKTHPRGTEPISTWAVLAELAAHEDRRGNWKEANAYYRRALELARRTPDADSYVAITAAQLASGLMNLGQVDNAEPLVQESLDIRRRLYTEESVPFAQALTVMTQVHLARGRLAEAEGTARKALAAYRKFAGEDSRFTIGAASYLALTLGRQERWPECAAVQRTILEWRERHSGPRDLRTAVEQVRMAEILFVLGEGARAEALLSTAVETFDAHVSDRVGLEMALTMLADHYDATGKPDEARAARDRLRALGPSAIPTDPVPAAAPASPGGAPPGPPGRDGLRR